MSEVQERRIQNARIDLSVAIMSANRRLEIADRMLNLSPSEDIMAIQMITNALRLVDSKRADFYSVLTTAQHPKEKKEELQCQE